MSTWNPQDPPQGSVGSTPDDDSVYVKEKAFHEDPGAWARVADDAPRVVVTSEDGEHIRFVIIQQREPLDLIASELGPVYAR